MTVEARNRMQVITVLMALLFVTLAVAQSPSEIQQAKGVAPASKEELKKEKEELKKEAKEKKGDLLCLNQPTPCSELGRTRLMALYTKAMLMSDEIQKAQMNAQAAVNAFNSQAKAVAEEEGQPEGTGYQVDLNNGLVVAVAPSKPPATTPAPKSESKPAEPPPAPAPTGTGKPALTQPAQTKPTKQ